MINEKIFIYGCGELGLLAKSFLEHSNIPFTPIDINPSNYKNSKEWKAYNITTIDSVPKDGIILICISTHSYNDIKNNLRKLGFKNVMSFFEKAEQVNASSKNRYPIRSGWLTNKSIDNDIKSKFSDKRSKYHYSQFHLWHTKYKEKLNEAHAINCTNRFFIDEIVSVLSVKETFVDVGAYDGRHSLTLINLVNGKFDKIHCIEPDHENFKKLSLNTNGIPNIENHMIALGNTNQKIGFNFGKGYVSSVDALSKQKTIIKKLDSLPNISPTIVKYHLEGHELEALNGSDATLIAHRPIVMVTTYHTEDGLYRIPKFLMKNLKEYSFLWRNHNYMGQGSVMYCIPKERCFK